MFINWHNSCVACSHYQEKIFYFTESPVTFILVYKKVLTGFLRISKARNFVSYTAENNLLISNLKSLKLSVTKAEENDIIDANIIIIIIIIQQNLWFEITRLCLSFFWRSNRKFKQQ